MLFVEALQESFSICHRCQILLTSKPIRSLVFSKPYPYNKFNPYRVKLPNRRKLSDLTNDGEPLKPSSSPSPSLSSSSPIGETTRPVSPISESAISAKIKSRKKPTKATRRSKPTLRKTQASGVYRKIKKDYGVNAGQRNLLARKSHVKSSSEKEVTTKTIDEAGSELPSTSSGLAKPQDFKLQGFLPLERGLELQEIENEMPPVPKLAHGLDRALFNDGILQLRDPHTRVYNFDPYLERIASPTDINFDTLKSFTPSSKDTNMARIALENNKRYAGSTSSMTSILKHFHFLLSAFRPLVYEEISRDVREELSTKFTKIQRAPNGVFLRWRNGIYSIDADKHLDSPNVLGMMGRYMEKLLTKEVPAYEQHLKRCSNPPQPDENLDPESHHYSSIEKILMRSQLDAYDPRLPGTGMFDLKTRAVLPIRMDTENFPQKLGYELISLRGKYHSYERELADMARSVLIKYSLQARIGRMDGIFLAYHNIDRLFGFQYMSLNDMDNILHGQRNKILGDLEFVYSVSLLSRLFDKLTERFPQQSLRILVDTLPTASETAIMNVFAIPVKEEDIEEFQGKRKQKIEEWEQEFLQTGVPPNSQPLAPNEESPASQPQHVDMEHNEASILDKPEEIAHISLEVRSTSKGREVIRPEKIFKSSQWKLYYNLQMHDDYDRALNLYQIAQNRQTQALKKKRLSDVFERQLQKAVEHGRAWRRRTDASDEEAERQQGGVLVWNRQTPIKREAFNAAT